MMLEFIVTVAIVIFVIWLVYRASTAKSVGKEIREVLNPHIIMYGLSCVSGVCAFAFFLSMDISKPFKIVVSIIFGMALIFVANWMQKRRVKKDYEA